MRQLTVVRKKSFVASLVTIRIFIKVDAPADLEITGTHLKLVGKLKSGESTTVEIPDKDVTLYVVYDKIFPERFHAKYVIQDTEEETIKLNTMPVFNPFKGNPFVISVNETLTKEEKQYWNSISQNKQQSKKSKAIFYIYILVCIIIGAIIGLNL